MASAPGDHHAAQHHEHKSAETIRYPTNHVIGVVDTQAQLASAAGALASGGFMTSEIRVHCGVESADALKASTGRTGLAGLAIRIAERIGVDNIEMEFKSSYEQAMRDGQFVVLVAAATAERKDRAMQLLTEHGAHTVTFHGRYSIEGDLPPNRP